MQVAIVSAGASGIGRAIAEAFSASGARVAICDIDQDAVEQALADGVATIGEVVDVADDACVANFVNSVEARLGDCDVLVNNAGIAGAVREIEAIAPSAWRRTFDVNVHGAFAFLQAVVPGMKARGRGAVINISTGSTQTLPTGRADYIASKMALEGLTRAAARELGPFGIRVNAIRPGFVDTKRMQTILERMAEEAGQSLEQLEARALSFIALRSKVQPNEIAEMAVFLASEHAPHVTGQIIGVDGFVEWEA